MKTTTKPILNLEVRSSLAEMRHMALEARKHLLPNTFAMGMDDRWHFLTTTACFYFELAKSYRDRAKQKASQCSKT